MTNAHLPCSEMIVQQGWRHLYPRESDPNILIWLILFRWGNGFSHETHNGHDQTACLPRYRGHSPPPGQASTSRCAHLTPRLLAVLTLFWLWGKGTAGKIQFFPSACTRSTVSRSVDASGMQAAYAGHLDMAAAGVFCPHGVT